jgi:DNA-binding response OmpR family regulator
MLDGSEAAADLAESSFPDAPDAPLALVFEARSDPERAIAALRAVRARRHFDRSFAIMAVTLEQVAAIDPASGFDDFVLHPYTLDELSSRLRALQWRRGELLAPKRYQAGSLWVDLSGHETRVDGRKVALTAKEFALLAYLCERPGRVLSRQELLARVWGAGYAGGSRTVDIHVRRLRAKLGRALTLDTLRGAGYKLRADWTDVHHEPVTVEEVRKSA